MNTKTRITRTNWQAVANELSEIMADENILYIKTKNAHWNIERLDLYDKQKFFELQLLQLDEIMDTLAERIRSLGQLVPPRLKFVELPHLTEMTRKKDDSSGFIKELLAAHEAIISKLYKNESKGHGISSFITVIMDFHEKTALFLRSHLKE